METDLKRYRLRKKMLRDRYRMTPDAYNRLVLEQNGLCAICGCEETRKAASGEPRLLSVDHNHTTHAVRGLLCAECNAGLGSFRDSPARLRAAALYLERQP